MKAAEEDKLPPDEVLGQVLSHPRNSMTISLPSVDL
jgi:hypothetical protein